MKMFLLGILAWSLASTIFYIIYENCSKYDIDFVVVVIGGPVLWLVALVCAGIRKIRWFIRHEKIKARQKKSS